MKVVYEDNHIIIVAKESGEIVQGDKTGDTPLSDLVKQYIKQKYQKPGEVFLGVCHRLDRPVSGLVVFARTSKALARLNKMFAEGNVHKTYWAITPTPSPVTRGETAQAPPSSEKPAGRRPPSSGGGWGEATHWLVRNEKQNKSYAYEHEVPRSKKAQLRYRVIGQGQRYQLLEVELLTGRHHQIRCQLAKVGMPIRGDLKYGAPRSNPDGSISLLSRRVEFIHPVSQQLIVAEAPVPTTDELWQTLAPAR